MEKQYVIYMPAKGEAKIVEFKRKEEGLGFYYKMLNCDCIDIVNPYAVKEEPVMANVCMVVDDEGLLKREPQLNIKASLLYGIRKHGQPIVGDVLLCQNKYTDDGIDTVGYTKEEAEQILDFVARFK